MFNLNKNVFILTSIASVDIATLIGYYIYCAAHPSVLDSEQKLVLTTFFIIFRVLLYGLLLAFSVDYNMYKWFTLIVVFVVCIDLLGVITASQYYEFASTIVVKIMFLVYDLSYFIVLLPLMKIDFKGEYYNNNDTFPKDKKTNITLISYIMYFDGMFLFFYVLILATVQVQLVTSWFFLFDIMNLYIALRITMVSTTQQLSYWLRYMFANATITLVLYLVVVIGLDNTREYQMAEVRALRITLIVMSFLYLFASLWHLQTLNQYRIASTIFIFIQVILPLMILLEFFLMFTYLIFCTMLRNPNENYFVVIHILDVICGFVLIMSYDDVFIVFDWFAAMAFIVIIYESSILVLYGFGDRNPAVLTFEAIMLAIPVVYVFAYAYIAVTTKLFKDDIISLYLVVYKKMMDLLDKMNDHITQLPVYIIPYLMTRGILSHKPKEKVAYQEIPEIATTTESDMEKKQNVRRAVGLNRAIHRTFIIPYIFDMACMISYVLGLIPDNEYENWAAYGNIFHIFTLLSGYYVLTVMEDVQKAISTQMGFSIFLFVWDMIYLIDYYALQWFGGNYALGFIILRYCFVIIDATYIVFCVGYQYKLNQNVYKHYATIMPLDYVGTEMTLEAMNEINDELDANA
jgi:hypothetical protein